MLGILVVSHGNLAQEFVDVASRILGEPGGGVTPVCIPWELESSAAKEKIRKALKKVQEESEGVLILTDLFGGTPTNLAMTLYQPGKVEILTGMNLPMLIKAILTRKAGTPLAEAVALLREKGQGAIVSVSEVMSPEGGEEG
jgi:PTS system mannose-specific IIA component